ncbi:MAG TPA: hypothetical protein PKH69_08580 [Thiobacillaceae bacterium]|nr:hypothetical protein [Thiobacillaceae bacterium]HNU64575.1 hypothetical protein [Thiobacillaceae bacterium]
MTAPGDIWKRRDLIFKPLPPGQTVRALERLSGLPGLEVSSTGEYSLQLAYDVREYTLEELENLLGSWGFHLEATVLIRIRRALAYHCERIQRDNLGLPTPRTKNYKAFAQAWQHQPHGDHDATPEEWRQYR